MLRSANYYSCGGRWLRRINQTPCSETISGPPSAIFGRTRVFQPSISLASPLVWRPVCRRATDQGDRYPEGVGSEREQCDQAIVAGFFETGSCRGGDRHSIRVVGDASLAAGFRVPDEYPLDGVRAGGGIDCRNRFVDGELPGGEGGAGEPGEKFESGVRDPMPE
jgi:hypothetical protein